MQNTIHTRNNQPAGELAWRLILIGVMALLMCSCRAPGMFKSSTLIEPARPATAADETPRQQDNEPVVVSISSNPPVTHLPGVMQQVAYQQPVPNPSAGAPTTLPRSAYTGEPPAGVDIPHLNSGGIPYPDNWRPPGIVGPWPADEYLYQGGDREQTVNVGQDWSIDNLDSEDAIVHYHTLEGKLVVQPTNQIPIYAPRFGSVRRMDNLVEFDNRVKLAGVDLPTKLGHRNSAQSIDGILQQMQPQHNLVVRSSSNYRENTQGVDLHNQEGWGRSPLAAGTKEGAMLEISAFKALKLSQSLTKGKLMVGISNMPGEDLGRGIGPGGLRVLVIEIASSSDSQQGQRTALTLWDANGFAPGMNKELQDGLKGMADSILLASTDNHYVNVKPGGHNPLSDSDGILPSARQALEEAIADISPAEAAMGTEYVDGVEILGPGNQDTIKAAANAVVEVARVSWLPIYSSATMLCLLLSPYI